MQDLVATTIGNTNAFDAKSISSKQEIIQACVASHARFNSVILMKVLEPQFMDTLKRRHFIVSKLEAIFEIIHTSYPLRDRKQFQNLSKITSEVGKGRAILN